MLLRTGLRTVQNYALFPFLPQLAGWNRSVTAKRGGFHSASSGGDKQGLFIGDIGESGAIERVIQKLGYWGNEVISGPDDVVAFTLKDGYEGGLMVVNTDMLVFKTDVPRQVSAYCAGWKSVVMACSDLFVKGVIPTYAVVSLGVSSDMKVSEFDQLIEGMRDSFEKCKVQYVGGDMSETDSTVVSITVMGEQKKSVGLLKRSAARSGDLIVTSGEYGLTGLGLYLALSKNKELSDMPEEVAKAICSPETDPRMGVYMLENKIANASADSSDGLMRTVSEIGRASGLGAEISFSDVPVPSAVQHYCEENGLMDMLPYFVLSGGEEFHQVFSVRPEMESQLSRAPSPVRVIGKFIQDQNTLIVNNADGTKKTFADLGGGYTHFHHISN